MVAQIARTVHHVAGELLRVEIALQVAAIVVVAWIAANRRQAVRRQRQEAGDRRAARNVFDVRIESAVLVHDQNAGKRPLAFRLYQVAAHVARGATGRRVLDVSRRNSRVGKRNGLRLGITRQ